jgi:hypothetical protein
LLRKHGKWVFGRPEATVAGAPAPDLIPAETLKHQMQRTIEAHAPEYLRNIVKVITETGLRI